MFDMYKEIADSYGISSNLVQAFISQESQWNPWAIRYEPTYSYLCDPDRFAKLNKITRATESTLQKMSWGLGQIMGAVARELGFEESLIRLTEPQVNIKIMCEFIKKLQQRSTKLDDIIAMYNGGPGALERMEGKYKNQGYVDSVNNYLQKTYH